MYVHLVSSSRSFHKCLLNTYRVLDPERGWGLFSSERGRKVPLQTELMSSWGFSENKQVREGVNQRKGAMSAVRNRNHARDWGRGVTPDPEVGSGLSAELDVS